MTLVTKKKPHHSHRKRTGAHQHRRKHFHKTYWPYLPLLLVVGLGFVANSLWPSHRNVLGYATDMSASSLLQRTNDQRLAHDQSGLRLDDKLTAAAQAKANDMAAKNYWSHNTPSGKTPWSFVKAAEYNYSAAGENLAYGFGTADATITGWMNSAEHRANILNDHYQEVGFGIADIPNYQGQGPETLVVAMYATPADSESAATLNDSALTQSDPIATDGVAVLSGQTASEAPSKQIARIQLASNGQAAWSLMASLVIVAASLGLLLLRHGVAWHRLLNRGEQFILKHPLLDIAAVSLVTVGFILSQGAGVIR